jgi:hypothetical protein
MATRILAIDPGEKVGWATALSWPATDDSDARLEILDYGIAGLKDFALALGRKYENYEQVIYETWRLRAPAHKHLIGNDMQTSQLIGMIRYLGWLHPEVKLTGQAPSIKATALKTMPEYVRQIVDGAPTKHDEAHYADAVLHAWHAHWRKYVEQAQAVRG